jgi:hypothetical protein
MPVKLRHGLVTYTENATQSDKDDCAEICRRLNALRPFELFINPNDLDTSNLNGISVVIGKLDMPLTALFQAMDLTPEAAFVAPSNQTQFPKHLDAWFIKQFGNQYMGIIGPYSPEGYTVHKPGFHHWDFDRYPQLDVFGLYNGKVYRVRGHRNAGIFGYIDHKERWIGPTIHLSGIEWEKLIHDWMYEKYDTVVLQKIEDLHQEWHDLQQKKSK